MLNLNQRSNEKGINETMDTGSNFLVKIKKKNTLKFI